MIDSPPLTGLIAATFTPFQPDGRICFEKIPDCTEFLIRNGVAGAYLCGSTGEGPSLTIAERKAVAEAYVKAAAGRLHTIVHIGHTCLADVRDLAAHAESIGADAISSVSPYYFKPENTKSLVHFLRDAARSAPTLPFYYYHIPSLTGVAVNPVQFLEEGGKSIPTLRGIKFTDSDLSLMNECQQVDGGKFDVLFGRDEMLLAGLSSGAAGAVGSTYNLAPKLYQNIIQAFSSGDMKTARECQLRSVAMIKAIVEVGGEAAIKYPMHRHGIDCGSRRLPMRQLKQTERDEIDRRLDAIGFDEWAALSVSQESVA
ncbi:MAG: dihydrodipicolinate synthase family protein [Verrucomicrobiales bacterium]|nr:dihydrodipicolinate synthase family protein [Verrucomicrobiales bacterium]